jgi:hypothetical protein
MIAEGKFKDEITNRLENNAAQWCVFARMRGREAPRDASEGWAGIEGSLAAHFLLRLHMRRLTSCNDERPAYLLFSAAPSRSRRVSKLTARAMCQEGLRILSTSRESRGGTFRYRVY